MSEEREVLASEISGHGRLKPCAVCGLPKETRELQLVPGDTVGLAGTGNVDICNDCYRDLQGGDLVSIDEPV
jgi:hypothetical protein